MLIWVWAGYLIISKNIKELTNFIRCGSSILFTPYLLAKCIEVFMSEVSYLGIALKYTSGWGRKRKMVGKMWDGTR